MAELIQKLLALPKAERWDIMLLLQDSLTNSSDEPIDVSAAEAESIRNGLESATIGPCVPHAQVIEMMKAHFPDAFHS